MKKKKKLDTTAKYIMNLIESTNQQFSSFISWAVTIMLHESVCMNLITLQS